MDSMVILVWLQCDMWVGATSKREVMFKSWSFKWRFVMSWNKLRNCYMSRSNLPRYEETMMFDNCSSCSCKWFSLKFTQCVTILQTVSNNEVTLKRLISMLRIAQKLMLGRKVIYVRCINCSYNNVAKGISLLDKKAIFYTG